MLYITNKPYSDLSRKQKKVLDYVSVNAYDIIKANSGGHPCITNISGINYLGKLGGDFLKRIAKRILDKLSEKVNPVNHKILHLTPTPYHRLLDN